MAHKPDSVLLKTAVTIGGIALSIVMFAAFCALFITAMLEPLVYVNVRTRKPVEKLETRIVSWFPFFKTETNRTFLREGDPLPRQYETVYVDYDRRTPAVEEKIQIAASVSDLQ